MGLAQEQGFDDKGQHLKSASMGFAQMMVGKPTAVSSNPFLPAAASAPPASGEMAIALVLAEMVRAGSIVSGPDLRRAAREVGAALAEGKAVLGRGGEGDDGGSDAREPAVPVAESIDPNGEFLVCLETGRKLKMLAKHLGALGLSPDAYRKRWGLPADYPMVAPRYSEARSEKSRRFWAGRAARLADGALADAA